MTDSDQLPLFDPPEQPQTPAPAPQPSVALDPQTPLFVALDTYIETMTASGVSIYTIKAFKSDIGLLAGWAGDERAIGDLGTTDLNKFLKWMRDERGVPCSPKTYARRITALKHFFGYLTDNKAIRRDPSNAVLQHTVDVPLPDVLEDDEVERALNITRLMREGKIGDKLDVRPHLLVTLLLETGAKKGEAVALRWEHIEREHPDGPRLWIRYENAKLRYKERAIPVSFEWLGVLSVYAAQQRKRGDTIFNRTARMMEYVLRDVALLAGIPPTRLSFETLRWTCALHDYKAGMEPEKLREKLGISRITWSKTSERLAKLSRGERVNGASTMEDDED